MNYAPFNLVFFGTPHFAVPALSALLAAPEVRVKAVITQPDRPAGRGRKITPSPVKEIAVAAEIPVLQPQSIRKAGQAFLDELIGYGPFDAGIVVSFGQILPVSTLNLPKAGCVNIHASLLPRWRGAAPIHRAVASGDSETGVCLMHMEEGLDTGPVYVRESLPIGPEDTMQSVHDKLAVLGARLLVETLPGIINGQISPVKQPEDNVTYAAKISADEARIPWAKNAWEVSCHIRGLSPFPGAFSIIQDKNTRLKVLGCRVAEKVPGTIVCPGTVIACSESDILVACGNGVLAITELQLEGHRRMNAGQFARGYPLSGVTLT